MFSVGNDRFHCPVDSCLYRVGSERYFKTKRLLDQHTMKVHAEKKFSCNKCSKGFSTTWQQIYHEKTCGIIWICSCGQKYNCKETLMTHSRRTGHQLPSNILSRKPNHQKQQIVVMPVAIIVQNISLPPQEQKSSKITPLASSNAQIPRKILPKATVASFPASNVQRSTFPLSENMSNTVSISTQTDAKCECEKTALENLKRNSNDSESLSNPNPVVLTESHRKERNAARRQSVKNAAGTQTCKRCIVQRAMRSAKILVESRGSQCTPRNRCHYRSRKATVHREHIETQTTESVVGRMKPAKTKMGKARRNLSNLLEQGKELPKAQIDRAAQSAWSSLDVILGSQWLQRCSSGTQTSPRSSFYRVMCDTQTITEPLLVNSVCASGETSGTNNGLLLETVVQHLSASLSSNVRENGFTTSSNEIPIQQQNGDYSLLNYMYDGEYENAPALSHMETQTCEELGFDFLTNMETQTTDDFFNDLELSDIQTQTPWTDLLDLCDNLDHSQLSAAIQTDITSRELSASDDKLRSDIADFMDTETQTHYNTANAEFTSSYTQTLDLSSYFDLG